MAAQEKIVVQQGMQKDNYFVTGLQNRLEPRVGTFIKDVELQKLISRGVNVVVNPRHR